MSAEVCVDTFDVVFHFQDSTTNIRRQERWVLTQLLSVYLPSEPRPTRIIISRVQTRYYPNSQSKSIPNDLPAIDVMHGWRRCLRRLQLLSSSKRFILQCNIQLLHPFNHGASCILSQAELSEFSLQQRRHALAKKWRVPRWHLEKDTQ